MGIKLYYKILSQEDKYIQLAITKLKEKTKFVLKLHYETKSIICFMLDWGYFIIMRKSNHCAQCVEINTI